MKCWKSAARNWFKRSKNETLIFPSYYDKKIEDKLKHDQKKLNKYYEFLEKLGWVKSYSPTAGTILQKVHQK